MAKVEGFGFCPICRYKTWHIDGACEWAGLHRWMEETDMDHFDRLVLEAERLTNPTN